MKIVLSLFLIVLSLLFYIIYSHEQESVASSTNVLIFLFVNINALFLLIFAFLVGREVVKLVIDRRRNILGSKLRLRLVVPFLGITAIPLVLLFILASGLLNKAFEGWFQSKIESARDASILLAKSYYDELSGRIVRSAVEISEKISADQNVNVQDLLERDRRSHNLFSLAIYDRKHRLIAESASPVSVVPNFTEPPIQEDNVIKAIAGSRVVAYEGLESRQFLRVYVGVQVAHKKGVLVVSNRIDPDINESFQVVRESYNEYQQLKLFRHPLRSGYLLSFALLAGMILFAALWMVVQIARGIVNPIERLVSGTQLISKGNYKVRIDPGGDDEIGYLITSFNQMACELDNSIQAADRQRLLVESILGNLTVGVVTLDRSGKVVLSNSTAVHLFNCDITLGEELVDILPKGILQEVQKLLRDVTGDGTNETCSVQYSLIEAGRELRLITTVVPINDSTGKWIYTLLLFDDITELAKAQTMSAWREVARRIAHEIKNPLTPLKLSAQRLQRKANLEHDRVLQESTQMIVEHVDSIKRLADEFSNFARMPTADFKEVAVESIITEVVGGYVETCNDINFQIICARGLPKIMIDPEQIRRVLVNLIDNAVSSVRSAVELNETEDPKITVAVRLDAKQRVIVIEVQDNGVGIAEADRVKVFDPYFTRKKGGTGLGLAIVSSVIAEHRGAIRALDNSPKGARFVIDLPLSRMR
jgi:two-component system nitrogen regulation sensor histidine kinase NtrY